MALNSHYIFLWFWCGFLAFVEPNQECHTIKEDIWVYFGWPFTYDCLDQFYDYDYETDLEYLGCSIKDLNSGEILFNATTEGSENPEELLEYRFDNITESTSRSYEAMITIKGSCVEIRNISLNATYLLEESCEENLQRNAKSTQRISKGDFHMLSCSVPYDDDNQPKHNLNPHEINSLGAKSYWLLNCQKELPANTKAKDDSLDLHLYNATYETNYGNHTCVVEYNGMKRYIITHDVCVKVPPSRHLSIKCTTSPVKLGHDVAVDCNIDAGIAVSNFFFTSAKVYKLNETTHDESLENRLSCSSSLFGNQEMKNSKVSCSLYSDTRRETCFDKEPTDEELSALRTKIRLFYRIRNIEESDLGIFEAKIRLSGQETRTNFTLAANQKSQRGLRVRILIILFCILGVLAVALLLICGAFKVEFRWLWYRMCIPREKGMKKFSVYLAYYYSREMTETTPSNLIAFVGKLNSIINVAGGEVYDNCKDPGSNDYKAESISSRIEGCQRVVIIITPEYVNDQWKVYEALQAWKSVIENDLEIIFIVFPRGKSALKEMPEDLKPILSKALKRHKVVHWDGNLPFTRKMRMQLEILMPKLEHPFDFTQRRELADVSTYSLLTKELNDS